MGPGECPPTYLGVNGHGRVRHDIDVCRALRVPQLTDIEVSGLAIDPFYPDPAEEDVAGRLHQSLALDDSPTVVVELALPDETLEHRRLGLLGLQEQGVLAITAGEQEDPGPGADAADTDHLAGEVDQLEALEQPLTV